jgi:hypothetical protein
MERRETDCEHSKTSKDSNNYYLEIILIIGRDTISKGTAEQSKHGHSKFA